MDNQNTQMQRQQEQDKALKKTVEDLITGDAFKRAVALSLPKHCKPERFIRAALTAFNRTPKLRHCTQESLFNCFLRLSELGIEADGRRAHLIPYGQECTLIVDYKGLAELILRSGEVSFMHADIVCANDIFDYNMGQILNHRINFREPRGEMYAAYALARLKDGNTVYQVLSREEVDQVRASSRAGGNGPWVNWYNEMAKKTAFRRLSKWLPLSPELQKKIESDDEAIELETVSVTSDSKEDAAAKWREAGKQIRDTKKEPAPEPSDPPTEETELADAGLAPETKPAAEPLTVYQGFERDVMTPNGITFDALRKWLDETGQLANADTVACLEELPQAVILKCKKMAGIIVKTLKTAQPGN